MVDTTSLIDTVTNFFKSSSELDAAKAKLDASAGMSAAVYRSRRTFDASGEAKPNQFRYPLELFNPSGVNQYGENWLEILIFQSKESSLERPAAAEGQPPPAGPAAGLAPTKSASDPANYPTLKSDNWNQGVNKAIITSTLSGGDFKATAAAAGASFLAAGAGFQSSQTVYEALFSIALYAPNSFSTRYGATWGEQDTMLDKSVAKYGNAVLEALKEGAKGKNADSTKLKGGLNGAVGQGALMMDAMSGGSVSMRSGLALNPLKQMQFTGVDKRPFSFEYQFAPKSEEERWHVMQIIYLLKVHMHPESVATRGPFVWVYPSEFRIRHKNGAEDNPFWPVLGSCVLTNMTVNYTSSGANITNHDGSPSIISVTLEFKEMATLDRAHMLEGY